MSRSTAKEWGARGWITVAAWTADPSAGARAGLPPEHESGVAGGWLAAVALAMGEAIRER
jgi:hypothetical protein